jgi:asparagine synthase (glutamine-hydrolysing)
MRLTHYYAVFYRSAIEVRYPFLDYAFFDFVCSLPPEIRLGSGERLYRELLSRDLPELTRIPIDKDECLPTNRRWVRAAHAAGQRVKRAINRHVHPVFPQRETLYADYEGYLRTDLREWAQDLLFGPRSLERGIFSRQYVESIWKRHQSGRELHTIGKIAPLMSYEMMLRRLYD